MKRKIVVSDKNGKIEKEVNVRQKGQYDTLLKYKSAVYRDRTKYTRKVKHKKRIDDGSLFFESL